MRHGVSVKAIKAMKRDTILTRGAAFFEPGEEAEDHRVEGAYEATEMPKARSTTTSELPPATSPSKGWYGRSTRLLICARRFGRAKSGAIALITALCLPVVVGFVGMGVEVGLWYQAQRGLQTATDAAAISGAYEAGRGYSNSVITESATSSAAKNGYDGTKNDSITVNYPPVSGAFTGDTKAVQVTMTRDMQLLFTSLFLAHPVTIKTSAVAVLDSSGDFCVLGLDPTASGGVSVGGTANVNLDCGIAANSNASDAIQVYGHADLTASTASTVGGITVSGSGDMTTVSPTTEYALPAQDPYSDLDGPTNTTCDYNSTTKVSNGDAVALSPGVYCADIRVTGGAVTFLPGTYVMRGANLKITGGSVLGVGTFFYFTEKNGTYAQVDITGGTINMSAPTSGTYQGVLFYQDRNAPTGSGYVNKINGNSATQFNGALYFPAQTIDYTGGSGGSGCTVLIGDKVTFSGNADMHTDCSSQGTKEPAATIVRLGA